MRGLLRDIRIEGPRPSDPCRNLHLYTEFERPLPIQSSQLADQGSMGSVPGLAHRMGHLGHLLFQSAVCWIACRVGDILCGTSDMAALAVARSARVRGLHHAVSRRGRLVDIHFSLSRSTMASGSRRDATGDH